MTWQLLRAIIICVDRSGQQPNIGDLHSGSAVDSDSTCGGSIPSSPTKNAAAFVLLRFLYHSSGCSAAGSASGSGPEGRGFKSRHSDQKPFMPYPSVSGFFDTEGRGCVTLPFHHFAKLSPWKRSIGRLVGDRKMLAEAERTI